MPKDAEIVDRDGKPHVKLRDSGRTVYVPLTADGTKYLKPSAKWHAWIPQPDGTRKRVALSPNRAAAERMLAEMVNRIEEEKIGIRTPATEEAAKPLAGHLSDWEASLRANRRDDEYVRGKLGRVRRVFDACRFVFPRDLTATAVKSFLHDLRETDGRSVQTSNDHLQAVKQFARWMVDNDRLTKNPFARLTAGNVATDVRHRRGEFTPDEVARLLTASATSPTPFRGLTGSDRTMLYRVALSTGFRAKELAALSAESFVLTADTPVAVLPAEATKNRRPVRQPIPTDLARDLAVFLAGRTGTVWPGTWPTRSADMIARDMTTAGISATVDTPDGEQVRDFHSTRNTFIGNVFRVKANVKEAMALARHSDPRLTTARYARVRADELAAVVNRTPALPRPPSAPSVPTPDNGRGQGTGEDAGCLPASGADADEERESPCRGRGLSAVEDDQGQPKAERKGFEPLVRFYPHAALAKPRAGDENRCDSEGILASPQPVSTTASTNPANPNVTLHTDLARVVELWPVLPPAIRNAILVLANTSAPTPPPPSTEDDRDRLPPGYEKRPDR